VGYEFDQIFPGCRIVDIHEYLLDKGVRADGVAGVRYLYHDPCHSPLKQQDPVRTVNALITTADAARIEKSERCCGESGTLAVTRPDIATQVRFRKEAELRAGAARLRAAAAGGDSGKGAEPFAGQIKVLTSCPSCLQGLTRYNDDAETAADYIVVELARHVLGPDWMAQYVERANRGGIERVLV
jgi:Fe-S oxidoreductase